MKTEALGEIVSTDGWRLGLIATSQVDDVIFIHFSGQITICKIVIVIMDHMTGTGLK